MPAPTRLPSSIQSRIGPFHELSSRQHVVAAEGPLNSLLHPALPVRRWLSEWHGVGSFLVRLAPIIFGIQRRSSHASVQIGHSSKFGPYSRMYSAIKETCKSELGSHIRAYVSFRQLRTLRPQTGDIATFAISGKRLAYSYPSPLDHTPRKGLE